MAKADGIEDRLGVSLLPGTKRSSTGSGLPFTSLYPYPPPNFKLKQTAHCLSITSEHQKLFTGVGRQASASPITSFKTQQGPDHKKSPTGSFQSIFFPGKKRLKHWTASAKKTPGRQFEDWRYTTRWVTHQFLCFVWDRGRFPPSVAEMLQHCSMKKGSVRPERSFRAEERWCSWAPLGSHRPSSRASGVEGREATGAAKGSRRPAGQSALPLLRGGRPGGGTGSPDRRGPRRRWLRSLARGAGTGGGAGSGRGGTPGHLAGVPATRAGIRLRRRVRTERGATRGRLRGLDPQEVGPWTPGLLAAAQHTGRLLLGSPPRGSHLRGGSRSSGLTRRWGREAGPEVGGEAWRPRAGSAAASTTRGRWDTLRLCPARQKTFRSGGANMKTNGRQPPVPARLSLRPSQPTRASPRDWPRPRPTSLRTGCGDWAPGRHDGSSFPCRRRLSLPCQRQPP